MRIRDSIRKRLTTKDDFKVLQERPQIQVDHQKLESLAFGEYLITSKNCGAARRSG